MTRSQASGATIMRGASWVTAALLTRMSGAPPRAERARRAEGLAEGVLRADDRARLDAAERPRLEARERGRRRRDQHADLRRRPPGLLQRRRHRGREPVTGPRPGRVRLEAGRDPLDPAEDGAAARARPVRTLDDEA